MIIACDGDAVCCDLMPEWLRRYNQDFNDTLTLDRIRGWGLHEYVKPECGHKIYEYLGDPDLYASVQPVEGALAGVRLLREMGHTVVFATSCHYGMTDQKARWFERHGFSAAKPDGGLPRDFIAINDKLKLDADLLIDDGAHYVRPWVEEKRRRAILFEYPWNKSLLDEVPSTFWSWCHRAANWPQIVRIVESFDA